MPSVPESEDQKNSQEATSQDFRNVQTRDEMLLLSCFFFFGVNEICRFFNPTLTFELSIFLNILLSTIIAQHLNYK